MAQTGSTGSWRVGALLMRFGVRQIPGQGAPTNGSSGTGAGYTAPGSIYFDSTNGVKYINVGTKAAPVWSPLSPVTIPVSSANILAMNGAPVSLVAAPPAGFSLVVDSILFEMITTSTQYAGGGVVSFPYHGGSVNTHTGTIPAAVVTAAAGTTLTLLGPATGANGSTVPTATGIDITNATAAFTTGTGTAKVIMDYRIVKQ